MDAAAAAAASFFSKHGRRSESRVGSREKFQDVGANGLKDMVLRSSFAVFAFNLSNLVHIDGCFGSKGVAGSCAAD